MRKFAALLASDSASLLFLLALLTVIALGTLGFNELYQSWYLWCPALLLAANLFRRAGRATASLSATITALGAGLTLFGILYSSVTRFEGVLPISVGESSDVVFAGGGAYRLPFSVCLDAFTVERNAASIGDFKSTLRLRAGARVAGRGVTSVNRPLRSNGFAFYQQSFDPLRPRWTGLKVVRDPGVKFVFFGLLLFNAGIIVCIIRRLKAG